MAVFVLRLLEWSTIPFRSGINYFFFPPHNIGIEKNIWTRVQCDENSSAAGVRLHLQCRGDTRTMRKRIIVLGIQTKMFRKNRGLAFCMLNVLSDAILLNDVQFQRNQRRNWQNKRRMERTNEREKNVFAAEATKQKMYIIQEIPRKWHIICTGRTKSERRNKNFPFCSAQCLAARENIIWTATRRMRR